MAQESRSSRPRGRNNSGGRDYRDRDRDERAPLPGRSGPNSLPPRPPPQAPRDAYRPPSNHRDQYSRDNDSRDSRYSNSRSHNDYDRRYPPPPMQSHTDNYRPPQGEFTFRADKPSGVQNASADTYRPQEDRSFGNRREQDARRYPRGGNANRARGGPHRGGRAGFPSRPWRPFVPAERELLSTSHSTGPELALYKEGGVTFRPVGELSDSEEAEMDISGDEDGNSAEPSHKRSRLARDQSAADGDSVPKWCNPDPYTAIPPGEAAIPSKKRDVVHLIRKARVTQTTDAKSSIPSEAADFIACDSSDESDHEPQPASASNSSQTRPPKIPGAPTGPRAPVDGRPGTELRGASSAVLQGSASQIKLSEGPPALGYIPLTNRENAVFRREAAAIEKKLAAQSLGSRKRTHDDVIKLPDVKLGKPVGPNVGRDGISRLVSPWIQTEGEDRAPWWIANHSDTKVVGIWLHKEIVDFYEYIRPRDFEERIRQELVDDLKKYCRNLWHDAEVYSFGSFPTGLYLPTSDMDLVVVSDHLLFRNGAPRYTDRKSLYRFGDGLRKSRRVHNNEIEFIIGARVPLVKFVDKRTRLKVDISFENPGGLQAVKTFNAWKEQYPAMPVLVTMIKHLLCMRGLNEPVNGGIGGFSVICLVVSMLQMMPEVQSRNMDPMHHLGDLFMHFLNFYGNEFNYKKVAICLNPPKYIPKNKVTTFAYKKHDRLSIIDPNNPENDIAGGSSLFPKIKATFYEAFKVVRKEMADAALKPRPGISFLRPIFGANYSSFRLQREHLERLANDDPRARDW